MTLVSAQRAWARPFWLCLMLLTIAFHAVVPYGSPFVRTVGSAFSATTVDVGLAPKRKDRLGTPEAREADKAAGTETVRAGSGALHVTADSATGPLPVESPRSDPARTDAPACLCPSWLPLGARAPPGV